jgi:hypothetical protein
METRYRVWVHNRTYGGCATNIFDIKGETMTEEIEKKEKSETEKTLSDYIESDTRVEFWSKTKIHKGTMPNMAIICNIHGLNCVQMSQKFYEWLKNDKEFIDMNNAKEVAEKI